MTDASLVLSEATALAAADGDWQRLPPKAAELAMIAGALWGLLLGLAMAAGIAWPLLVAWPVLSLWPTVLVLAGVALVLMAAGMWLAWRRWKFTWWQLDATGLAVRRGRWWQKQVLVPRSRVQHLDIQRGPIERHFGLATLTVHTAGTRQHALRQGGLRDADAVALRDALVPAAGSGDDVL